MSNVWSCPVCHERNFNKKVSIDVKVDTKNLRLTMERGGDFGTYVHMVLYSAYRDQILMESYIKVLDLFKKNTRGGVL